MEWHEVAKRAPLNHVTVMLYRIGDLYPVVGARWGRDPNGDDPDRVLWTIEEGGAEDGDHRVYPFLEFDPTHWADLPSLPE